MGKVHQLENSSSRVWKTIPGYSRYEVSACGTIIRKIADGTAVTQSVGYKDYVFASLVNDAGKTRWERVHRVVALAHHGPPPSPDHTHVRHRDNDKRNNSAENVRWSTRRENDDDVIRHGTQAGIRYVLTQADRDAILGSKIPTKVLANRYGVSETTIERYKTGRSRRKPLPPPDCIQFM